MICQARQPWPEEKPRNLSTSALLAQSCSREGRPASGYNRSVNEPYLKTPLYAQHSNEGARLVEFAGYEMPVQYGGVIQESQAVRKAVGMFDVSHMGRLTFTGEKVLEYLERLTTNDVAKLDDMKGQYSLLPNSVGGVVDDVIVYRIDANEYRMVVNAANHEKDLAHFRRENSFGVEIEDTTDDTAMIAVQGPRAAHTIAALCNRPGELAIAKLFGVVEAEVAGCPCWCARSGYTGEDGFELICAASDAPRLWQALHEAGVVSCGLGARDVLRVEAGLPLYGHELLDDVSPIESGLGWVVSEEKGFIGSEIVNRVREEGPKRKLRGIRLDGRRLLIPGMEVTVDGREVGSITSGIFSPELNCGIAFAFIDAGVKLKTPCHVEIRGKREPAMVVGKRFYKRPTGTD